MRFRGAFHAHSTFSYDGRDTLKRLTGELRRRGYQFLLLTEHDDKLTAEAFGRVVAAAAELSGPEFLVVPGLEIRCWRHEHEQWHIAALGVREWIPRGPIPEVARAIHAAGGLAILLHPYKHAPVINPAELGIFDGIEIWNGKFDGFYAPQGRTLRLFHALQELKSPPAFYCGHDLHGVDAIAPLALEVEADRLEGNLLLAALRSGRFELRAGGGRFTSRRGPSFGQEIYLRAVRAGYVVYKVARRLPFVGAVLGAARDTVRPADPFDSIPE